jgi:hypothetical protein
LFETIEKNNHEIHRTRARHLHIQLSREIKTEVKQIGTYQEMTRTSKPHLCGRGRLARATHQEQTGEPAHPNPRRGGRPRPPSRANLGSLNLAESRPNKDQQVELG